MKGPDHEDEEDGSVPPSLRVRKKILAKRMVRRANSGHLSNLAGPEAHDELLEIVRGVDEADVPTIVKHICTLHNASLADDNKFKLQGFAASGHYKTSPAACSCAAYSLCYENLSKRFVPEANNFLANATLHLALHPYRDASFILGDFPLQDFRLPSISEFAPKKAKKSSPGRPSRCLSIVGLGEQEKADLLAITLELLSRLADIDKGLEGFIELLLSREFSVLLRRAATFRIYRLVY
ncbi:hypothetical protein TRAPUB_8023, partial [Trametes pubescens]